MNNSKKIENNLSITFDLRIWNPFKMWWSPQFNCFHSTIKMDSRKLNVPIQLWSAHHHSKCAYIEKRTCNHVFSHAFEFVGDASSFAFCALIGFLCFFIYSKFQFDVINWQRPSIQCSIRWWKRIKKTETERERVQQAHEFNVSSKASASSIYGTVALSYTMRVCIVILLVVKAYCCDDNSSFSNILWHSNGFIIINNK